MIVIPIPTELSKILEMFNDITDRRERSDLLIYYADKYKEVPESIAKRPFADDHQVPYCESQAYVWMENPENDKLHYYFAVENPQGISAKAMASILMQTVSGSSAKDIIDISPEIVYTIFGNGLGMVRAEGLRGMVKMVRAYAIQFLNKN